MKEEIIAGNKDLNVDGWKVAKFDSIFGGENIDGEYTPYSEEPCYDLAYWENGKIVEETEYFWDSEIIALNEYSNRIEELIIKEKKWRIK